MKDRENTIGSERERERARGRASERESEREGERARGRKSEREKERAREGQRERDEHRDVRCSVGTGVTDPTANFLSEGRSACQALQRQSETQPTLTLSPPLAE